MEFSNAIRWHDLYDETMRRLMWAGVPVTLLGLAAALAAFLWWRARRTGLPRRWLIPARIGMLQVSLSAFLLSPAVLLDTDDLLPIFLFYLLGIWSWLYVLRRIRPEEPLSVFRS